MGVNKESGRRRRVEPMTEAVAAEPVTVAVDPVEPVAEPAEVVYITPDEAEVEVPQGRIRTQEMIKNWGPVGVWYRPGDEPKG